MEETINDPLSILLVPHEVIKWQEKQGLLMKKYFPKQIRKEKESGKYAIFHNTLRLIDLYGSEKEAKGRIDEIVGNKRECIKNERVYQIKKL